MIAHLMIGERGEKRRDEDIVGSDDEWLLIKLFFVFVYI